MLARISYSQELKFVTALYAFVFFFGFATAVTAQGPKVLENKPNDSRLKPVKDLDGYFPFDPPASKQEWLERKKLLQTQVKVALGLFPEPTRTPLNAVVFGKSDQGDYTVEKVFFESMPGYYVTGSLYRPKSPTGKCPAVLCPHGHWANGRFYDAGEANAKNLVKEGGESDVEAARNHIQARCVHLARMGCVVLQYDMIGYADSVQVSFDLAHRFAKQRPDYNSDSGWGFFSPQAEQHLQSIMGLQSWNSVRALDFLETLPDVDKDQFAVTGASGGGTQTFLLAAIDDRIKVSFPAVMVSTAMQGGCTCENCCLLRVTTGNVELAGLFAPKPQGVTAANDWTKEMRTKGYPQLQKLYELLGAKDKLTFVDRTEFGHNYNQVSRTALYQWLAKHFGLKGSIKEKPFTRLSGKELTVWGGKYKKPAEDPAFERNLLSWWRKDSDAILEKMSSDSDKYPRFLKDAYAGVIQRQKPAAKDVTYETTYKKDHGDYFVIGGPVRNQRFSEEFPAVFVHPRKWDGRVVILTSEQGKNALFKDENQPTELVKNLVDSGVSVVGVDLLFQGEFTDGKIVTTTRRVKNPREAAAYTFGYNHTLFAQRAHDLANLITVLANHEREPKSMTLVGLDQTGAVCAAALTIDASSIDRLVITDQAKAALGVDDIHSPYFLPGAGKYKGVEGMLIASGVKTSSVKKIDAETLKDLRD